MTYLYECAIEKWGADSQIELFIEECSEAIHAVQKCKRHGFADQKRYDNLIQELADLEIMLEQMRLIFGEKTINDAKMKALKKLEDRLKN